MLILTKISTTTWLVQYNNNVFRVRDTFIANMASRKNAMTRIRHIIAKATKKNADRFRHVENRVNHGHWSQYWIEV